MRRFSALSLVAPGGDRIRSGEKTLEIRRWRPETLPLMDLLIVQNTVRLDRSGPVEDTDGRAIALVDIEAVSDWRQEDLAAACGSYWEEGWLAWRITNVRPLDGEFPVTAKRGIYEVEIPSSAVPSDHGDRPGPEEPRQS